MGGPTGPAQSIALGSTVIRYWIWAGVCLVGVILGFLVGLGLAVTFSSVEVPDDSLQERALVAVSYAAWALVTLTTAIVAWRLIVRR